MVCVLACYRLSALYHISVTTISFDLPAMKMPMRAIAIELGIIPSPCAPQLLMGFGLI
jgi:hypothetical protein